MKWDRWENEKGVVRGWWRTVGNVLTKVGRFTPCEIWSEGVCLRHGKVIILLYVPGRKKPSILRYNR
jgi:hypothetical protein